MKKTSIVPRMLGVVPRVVILPPADLVPRQPEKFKYTMLSRSRTLLLEGRSWLRNKLPDFTGLLSVKGQQQLVSWVLKAQRVVVGVASPSWIKTTYVFSRWVRGLWSVQGSAGVVKYLKACHVLTQQAIGGYRIKDVTKLGPRVSRTNAGLPRIIPVQMRQRIRAGDIVVMKFWLTLFSLYRVIEFTGSVKTSTITNPGVDIRLFRKDWKIFVEQKFIPLIKRSRRPGVPWVERGALQSAPFPISKAGPTGLSGVVNTSWPGIVAAALLIWKDQALFGKVRTYANLTYNSWVPELIQDLATRGVPSSHNVRMVRHPSGNGYRLLSEDGSVTHGWQVGITYEEAKALLGFPLKNEILGERLLGLGKLGLKQEPAGKVRVFAMVDAWTQWLLRPLHEGLFRVLRTIPQDGTFDQMAPIRRLIKDLNCKRFWSYDLSAATDRLPVSLQADILDQFFGPGFGSAWKELLIDRDYYCPDRLGPGATYNPVRYAVGQPMGALSSWAMLAMTHHALIQYAADRVARRKAVKGLFRAKWFGLYAVLGDDVVIADGPVAREYLLVMQEIGVEVGLAKSLVSPRGETLEFAKRFFYKGQDASPLSFLELAVSRLTLPGMAELALKWDLSYASVLSVLGYGYKVKGAMNQSYDRLTGRLSGILWVVAKRLHKYSMVQWVSLQRVVNPVFDPRLSPTVQNWYWSQLIKEILKWAEQSVLGRVTSVSHILKWMEDTAVNSNHEALRTVLSNLSYFGSHRLVEIGNKVCSLAEWADTLEYDPDKLFAELDSFDSDLSRVTVIKDVTYQSEEIDTELLMMDQTLARLRLLRLLKRRMGELREPMSVSTYVRMRWDSIIEFVMQTPVILLSLFLIEAIFSRAPKPKADPWVGYFTYQEPGMVRSPFAWVSKLWWMLPVSSWLFIAWAWDNIDWGDFRPISQYSNVNIGEPSLKAVEIGPERPSSVLPYVLLGVTLVTMIVWWGAVGSDPSDSISTSIPITFTERFGDPTSVLYELTLREPVNPNWSDAVSPIGAMYNPWFST